MVAAGFSIPMRRIVFLLAALDAVSSALAGKPHVLFILVDDLGWGNVGFNRETPDAEVITPNLDAMVASGIHLTRHYVHRMCTPTRTSVQSGRLPVHVNIGLGDPCLDDTGIPREMTGFAEKLRDAGYKTHFAGKWDAGMATPKHTPHGRGYDTSLHYFGHKNDYWDQRNMQTCCEQDDPTLVDFWRTDHGASDVNGTGYSEFLYMKEMVNIIQAHDVSFPLLLFYAPHVAHCPLQVPKDYYDKLAFMTNDESQCSAQTVKGVHSIDPNHPALAYKCRQQYHAMVMIMDEVVGNITDALKAKSMWDNTLVVFSSDNGGPVDLQESAANNWPLRGGKYSHFEGGIRVAAFVSGGFVPQHLRGTKNNGMVHIADWYSTLCGLAGADPIDHTAAVAGLPPIDSIDMWPFLSGVVGQSPREVIPVDTDCLIRGDYKLITGKTYPEFWQSPNYPNSTSELTAWRNTVCTDGHGCLYNVADDATEQKDISAEFPEIVIAMKKQLADLTQHFFQNVDKFTNDCPASSRKCACWMAKNKYGGFLGPFAMTGLDGVPLTETIFM